MTPVGDRAVLETLDGGLLTTVQDGGRPRWAHVGVPESGAADPWALAVANLLVGNHPGDAVLELTVAGGAYLVRRDVTIGLAGADLGARVGALGGGHRRLAPGRGHRLTAGTTLELPGGASQSGAVRGGAARAYLAVPGGFDVPVVLGSRSTCLPGGFGGLDGRALRAGDLLAAAGPEGALVRAELAWPTADPTRDADATPIVRVLAAGRGASDPGLDALVAGTWRVAAAADRVGIRLDGDPLPEPVRGEALTHGVAWGTVQVPPDGRPILLGPDHQTTGGYRVAGVVISADRPVLGQFRPGEPVHLAACDLDEAVAALRQQRETLRAAAAALREAARWDTLADAAGG